MRSGWLFLVAVACLAGCRPGEPAAEPRGVDNLPPTGDLTGAAADATDPSAKATPRLPSVLTAIDLANLPVAENRRLVATREVTEKYPDGTPRISREANFYSDGSSVSQGAYVEYHANGKKFCEGRYLDGQRAGEWNFWYDNGTKAKSGSYLQGKPDGAWSVWRVDGTKERDESYAAGIRDGKWMYYDDVGKPQRQEEYVAGKRQGAWIEWYSDGRKAIESHLAGDELNGVQQIWHRNGRPAQLTEFKNGRRHGRCVTWNDRGEKTSELVYVNDVVVKGLDAAPAATVETHEPTLAAPKPQETPAAKPEAP